MMEPVARIDAEALKELEKHPGASATVWSGKASHRFAKDATPLVRLSDAEARIAELEAALDEKEIASGLTSDGNLWRYWASKAKDLALKNADLIRERDAAEALLKEAGPIIEMFAQIGEYVLAEAPAEATMWYAGPSCTGEHMAQVSLDYFRAARSIASKIGGGE